MAFQDRSTRTLKGLVSTEDLRESPKKSDQKRWFSGQLRPNGPRFGAKNCDFLGVLFTTQYTGRVDHVVDSVLLGLKTSSKKRGFWGGGVVLRYASPRWGGAEDIDIAEAWHAFIMRCPIVFLCKKGCGQLNAFDAKPFQ